MGIGTTKQIKITRFTPVKNGSGDNTETATDIYLGWAEVVNISGSRRFVDMPINQKIMRFSIRNRPKITPSLNDVVEYDGRKHTVQDVQKAQEKRFKYDILAISV